MGNKIKAILWDIDGVIIRHKESFDSYLENKGYLNAKHILSEFRCTKLDIDCYIAKFDPLIEIMPFLERIGWRGTSNEYCLQKYDFESQFIDYNLIKTIQNIRKKGIKSFIASNQNYYRKKYLVEKMHIESNFEKAYFSCDFGFIKSDKKYWKYVVTDIGKYFSEISKYNLLFVDDHLDNVESAIDYGIESIQITTEKDIESMVQKLK